MIVPFWGVQKSSLFLTKKILRHSFLSLFLSYLCKLHRGRLLVGQEQGLPGGQGGAVHALQEAAAGPAGGRKARRGLGGLR